MLRILVIDDETIVRKTIKVTLERAGHEVVEAADGRAGLDELQRGNFDLVITDILMPEQEGIETIRAVRRAKMPVKILAISGGGRQSNVNYLQMADKLGADDTLEKPFLPDQLMAKISRLCPESRNDVGSSGKT